MTEIYRVRDKSIPQAFRAPDSIMSRQAADDIVGAALAKWHAATPEESRTVAATLDREFPDQARPGDFWDSEASGAFRDFFVWGHNHDFGNGCTRTGAMGTRHVEIAAEALQLGMLPSDLKEKRIL